MREFDRIIGYAEIKKELEQIADVLRNTAVYASFGVKAPQGLLLYGDPGVGKTLMADCLAQASGRTVCVCRKNEPNGDFIKTIRKTFQRAAEQAPSVILLDDMDKFSNADERRRDTEEYVTVQSCIDEIRDRDVFVLATVNETRRLPHSLLRAGRFDRKIRIRCPEGEDARAIIRRRVEQIGLPTDVPLDFLSRLLSRSSCAELESILNEAGVCACFERSRTITMQHVLRAYLRRHNRTAAEEDEYSCDAAPEDAARAQICMHEAGHAAVCELLYPGSVTLAFVSVGTSAERSGGAVISEKPDDMISPDRMANEVRISLAGIAANEALLGRKDTGGFGDLLDAYQNAAGYVTHSGAFGLGYFTDGYEKSDRFMQYRETVVAAEVERLHSEVRCLLVQNSAFVRAIADRLYQKGVLTMYDVAEIRAQTA